MSSLYELRITFLQITLWCVLRAAATSQRAGSRDERVVPMFNKIAQWFVTTPQNTIVRALEFEIVYSINLLVKEFNIFLMLTKKDR